MEIDEPKIKSKGPGHIGTGKRKASNAGDAIASLAKKHCGNTGGLADDWQDNDDVFNYQPLGYCNFFSGSSEDQQLELGDELLSRAPSCGAASEPEPSEPDISSSRPLSRASNVGTDDSDEEATRTAAGVHFGGLDGIVERENQFMSLTHISTRILKPSQPVNTLTKITEDAPERALENLGRTKKKKARQTQANLDSAIKERFKADMVPWIAHLMGSVSLSFFSNVLEPDMFITPTPAMLQSVYNAIILSTTKVPHEIRRGDAVAVCAGAAVTNWRNGFREAAEHAVEAYLLDCSFINPAERARVATYAIERQYGEDKVELADRLFLWARVSEGFMESFHLLYCLGYHIVKVSNFPKAAAAIRTDEGRPRGALLLAVLACYRAFKGYQDGSGIFPEHPDKFSEVNYGPSSTEIGDWTFDIYDSIQRLDNAWWDRVIPLAKSNYDQHHSRKLKREMEKHVAQNAAATKQAEFDAQVVRSSQPRRRPIQIHQGYPAFIPTVTSGSEGS
ncbi:hypothetical protein BT96DRAFT_637315 [Gymnopus androsaceus JB14]|uniref:Uncharacterized protein n=1 Tax=Gymnopus androsaceus JB14 TaxID=1447944 RepID=A0A6A4GH16_9AGAR|nr:hypothetical protein BT96DRAFT_637315 [Gymnopus androsaceus JB14]